MTTDDLLRTAGKYADGENPDEAVEICHKVLLNEPDNPAALYILGCVLLKSARHVQAIQIGKRITALRPNDPRGYGLLALCWGELHKYDESIAMAERALACKRTDKTLSDCCYAHNNAGNWDIADRYGREAVTEAEINPTESVTNVLVESLVALAYIRLAKQDWKAGFEGYRRTLRTKWRKEWQFGNSVEWKGERDAILIVAGEQGVGDEIMAASCIPDAIKACKTFILDCDHRLGNLFRRSFPGAIISPTRRQQEIVLPVLPTHHKSLFGLGEHFRQRNEDFPRTAYLKASPHYVAAFKALLTSMADGPWIGLSWSGGYPRTGESERRVGVNALLPLIRRGGNFVSLEYKDDREEIAAFQRQHGYKVHDLSWVTKSGDFDLMAGLMCALDEVVGIHTTALHLSSALGVPTTVLTHRGSGWRYAPDELLWYPPTTQMHKKRVGESWRECVERLVEIRK